MIQMIILLAVVIVNVVGTKCAKYVDDHFVELGLLVKITQQFIVLHLVWTRKNLVAAQKAVYAIKKRADVTDVNYVYFNI